MIYNNNNNNSIIAYGRTERLEKRWRDTNTRIATTHVLHFNTLRRRPLRQHYTHTPPPAAHEFENRITQTPCRQLYLCVDIIYTQYDLQLQLQHYR